MSLGHYDTNPVCYIQAIRVGERDYSLLTANPALESRPEMDVMRREENVREGETERDRETESGRERETQGTLFSQPCPLPPLLFL